MSRCGIKLQSDFLRSSSLRFFCFSRRLYFVSNSHIWKILKIFSWDCTIFSRPFSIKLPNRIYIYICRIYFIPKSMGISVVGKFSVMIG